MTVPTPSDDATSGIPSPYLLAETIQLVAVSLPIAMLVLFIGIIWLLGLLVPWAHSNSQKTGRQAIAMVRIMARRYGS